LQSKLALPCHAKAAVDLLRLIDDRDPDEWVLPPKPKRMRWHTYDKQVEKFDHYEGQLNALCARTLRRILNQS
jgi:hypothetical protein